MPADNAKGLLLDRRRLLEHVLQVHKSRGIKVQLPIGMTAAEPWLLDSVDVSGLLGVLAAADGGKAPTIDLLALCQTNTRAATTDSKAPSIVSSRRTSEAAGQEVVAPQLQLPQLTTGLSEAEVKDLAYLVFASNCTHEADLLATVRGQLDIDEARAAEVELLLGLVSASMRQQAGPLLKSTSWTASLELPLCMLGVVMPRDFSRFRSFVMWRDTLSHVLLATLAQSVKEGWCPQAQQQQQLRHDPLLQQEQQAALAGSGGGTAQQLMARLKAALRRLDVRDADDFDEAEYKAASAAVRQQAQAVVQCTPAGWSFPWGLRVRLYEMLLRAVFDTLDEAEYVAEKDIYLHVLETRIRPLLGIAAPMHAAMMAWVHFRQYVVTQAPHLLAETRTLLFQLASSALDESGQQTGGKEVTSTPALAGNGAPSTSVPTVNGSAVATYSQLDAVFAKNVGQAVVDWILERLSDYHTKVQVLGGPDSVAGLVDLLVFASTCRGASQEEVGRALLEAVSLSTAAELHRRLTAAGAAAEAGDDSSSAAHCAEVCRTVRDLVAEEHAWTRGFQSQLPEAFSVALSVLQEAAGAVLLPWLSTQPVLDDDACEALRCALELEPKLMTPIRVTASGSCRYACTARLFASVKPWNMPAQLQPLLSTWLDKQMSGFSLWVDRQLQQEDWKPLGPEQPQSASARELRRIAMESLDALFGLQLPLPPATVRQYMQGIAGMMIRYLDAILTLLGSETVMIPPTPHLTRYKREVAVKQEEAESQLPGMPTQQPPVTAVSRKGVHFEDSVRRIEDEPCAARVSGLTSPVLVVMMASLAYLAETLQLLASSVKQLRQQEQQARGSISSPGGLESCNGGPAGGSFPVCNPFLAGDDVDDGFGGTGPDMAASSSRDSSTAGGGGALSPVWGTGKPPLQQQQQQQQQPLLSGLCWRDPSRPGWSSDGGGAGSFGGKDEQFGGLHDTGQKLRMGLASVARWLAVRVVWWEQRAAWCELLYRHRVTSCRIDWLLEGLAGTLQDHISLLPQDLYGFVALELLQQAARALERVLIDGGPCRWFIPADVDHIKDDTEELRKLFFQAGVPMQDIRTALLGLDGVLKLMRQQTGPLVEAHRAARRAALLAGPAAPTTPSPPPTASSNSTTAFASSRIQHSRTPTAGTNSNSGPALGPLAAAKLAKANQASPTAALATGSGGGSSSGGVLVHHSRQPTGGSASGGGFDDAASYSSYSSSSSPSWAAAQAAKGGSTGAAGALGGVGCLRRTAMDVAAAGGDVEAQEPILLRVLCHRADHAASKYLKDNIKVPKVRDETIKEALGRFTRLNRI